MIYRRKISLLGLLGLIAVIAVLLRFCIEPMYRRMTWRRLEREISKKLISLEYSPTNTIDPENWKEERGCVFTAYCNIYNTVTLSEMQRLNDDLDRKLSGKIDFRTLEWIWYRLGETRPEGKRYSERFESLFRELFPAIVP